MAKCLLHQKGARSESTPPMMLVRAREVQCVAVNTRPSEADPAETHAQSHHGVGLARPGLPIGKYTRIVAISCTLKHLCAQVREHLKHNRGRDLLTTQASDHHVHRAPMSVYFSILYTVTSSISVHPSHHKSRPTVHVGRLV